MKGAVLPLLVALAALFASGVVLLFVVSSRPSASLRSQQDIAAVAAEQANAAARQAQAATLVEVATDAPLRVGGMLVALLAGVELLRGVYRGVAAEAQLPALVAVLAGLLMVSHQWPLAAAAGGVGVAVALRAFAPPSHRPHVPPRTAGPGASADGAG